MPALHTCSQRRRGARRSVSEKVASSGSMKLLLEPPMTSTDSSA